MTFPGYGRRSKALIKSLIKAQSNARSATTALLAFLILLGANAAQGQWADGESTRAGRWETSLGLYFSGSESADGVNQSSIDVDSGFGMSFGFGYNFTQNIALRFDGAWYRADYDAVLDSDDEGLVNIDHTLSAFSGHVNGVWHILDGAFTPYLQAGIGWTYIDSNVTDGAVTGCWWDPWWGYTCAPFFTTYTDTSFSYSFGAGLRYEFDSGMYARGGWEQTRIDGGKGADPSFDSLRLEIGWLF